MGSKAGWPCALQLEGKPAHYIIKGVVVLAEPYRFLFSFQVGDWSDFRDGKAFAALLNVYDERFLDWNTVGEDGVDNLTRAFKGFEEHLSIPQLIDPKEVANGTADERSLTLYTSLIYHAHATAAERLRLQREARLKEQELENQKRLLEAQSKVRRCGVHEGTF